jgi:hypothetical protein
MDGLDIGPGISTLLSEALLGFEATAFVGFGLFLGVSFHGGHGELLRLKWFFDEIEGNHTPVKAAMRRDGMH